MQGKVHIKFTGNLVKSNAVAGDGIHVTQIKAKFKWYGVLLNDLMKGESDISSKWDKLIGWMQWENAGKQLLIEQI